MIFNEWSSTNMEIQNLTILQQIVVFFMRHWAKVFWLIHKTNFLLDRCLTQRFTIQIIFVSNNQCCLVGFNLCYFSFLYPHLRRRMFRVAFFWDCYYEWSKLVIYSYFIFYFLLLVHMVLLAIIHKNWEALFLIELVLEKMV